MKKVENHWCRGSKNSAADRALTSTCLT